MSETLTSAASLMTWAFFNSRPRMSLGIGGSDGIGCGRRLGLLDSGNSCIAVRNDGMPIDIVNNIEQRQPMIIHPVPLEIILKLLDSDEWFCICKVA